MANSHPLRIIACLTRHHAHIVRWRSTVFTPPGGWMYSRCVWCRATPDQLEQAGSFPFFNVDSSGAHCIGGVTTTTEGCKHNGRFYPLSFLAAYGLTWGEIKDK